MKGLILSGGKGTRLRPITYTSAKQLVPVGNKPILFYGIEALKEAGINDIGIIVGDTADEIKSVVGDGSKWDLNITYICQQAPLGLAHAVKISQDFLRDDDFIMYLGDNLIASGVKYFVELFNSKDFNSQILLAHVPNPSQFGVAEIHGHKVVKLVEKPKEPKSDLALVGVYIFDKNIFKAVKEIEPSGRDELEITDAIQWLIENNFDVRYKVIEGWWKDTGKLEDMLEANRIVLENNIMHKLDSEPGENVKLHGKVNIGRNCKIENSQLRGPLIIGNDVEIINSYIGPYSSISDNVKIENSELEHSIVLQNCKIMDIEGRIEGSLIGKGVIIKKSITKPRSYQFMIGDNSEIIIF